jgi:hypothetical protein
MAKDYVQVYRSLLKRERAGHRRGVDVSLPVPIETVGVTPDRTRTYVD